MHETAVRRSDGLENEFSSAPKLFRFRMKHELVALAADIQPGHKSHIITETGFRCLLGKQGDLGRLQDIREHVRLNGFHKKMELIIAQERDILVKNVKGFGD